MNNTSDNFKKVNVIALILCGQIRKCGLSVIPIFLFFNILIGQPNTITPHYENSQLIRDFSGQKWKMKMMLPGQGIKAGLHNLPPEDIETLVWNVAEVPGDVYTDLWKVGAIDDPYFGRNSVRAQWVQQYEWWYAYQFNVTEEIDNQVVKLLFEGVDYSCDVWLNGIFLGHHEGAFSSFSFDVNDALRVSKENLAGKNMLVIKLDPPPQVNALVAGKKTPWFGDYWRDLIPFGIWRPIKMITSGTVRFDDVYINSKIFEDGSAKVNFNLDIENTTDEAKKMTFVASVEGKNFESEPIEIEFEEWIQPGLNTVNNTLDIDEARLWWPWDIGLPNLYKAKVSIKEGVVNQDFKQVTFGIREVTMEWNPGFEKDVDVSFPRSTYINGKFHFIRSACWGGPPDIFVGRTSIDEYAELIRLAKEANMNNIRIFGWHPPEIPEFYELCDEAGITVWQDMIPLGTGNIPSDRDKLEEIFQEAVTVIKERRNHPSLIMMEGGEELFLRTRDPLFARSFLEELGDSLQAHVDLPYVPDSPLTCDVSKEAGYKPKEAVHALGYFYGMGHWLHEDWLQELDYPIVPEFAITSIPSVESLQKFIPQNEMWPPGLSWGHHWADLDRLKMQNWDVFGSEMIGSLEEFVNASQDAQGIIFQNGIEYFRRHKPNLSGIALCHFITYWPDMKWGIVDNYQQPKRSFDYVKKAYQPLLININFPKRRWSKHEPFTADVWVVNDYYRNYSSCTADVMISNDRGELIKKINFEIDEIAESSARKIYDLSDIDLSSVDGRFMVEVFLKDSSGVVISRNDYFFLIGNQEEASLQYKKMGKKLVDKNGEYTYGNYYRFFDDMSRKNGKMYQSDSQTPRSNGFENKK